MVAVSGANQYKVKPLALVRTVTPPIVAVFSVLLLAAAGALEAGAEPEEAPPELVELEELPQAAIMSAAARTGAASHVLFIAYPV